MKKIFLLLILAVACVFASKPEGVPVNVELITGAKQKAQFLGIHQDTVHLGGIIQGKFVVVKIQKERFKSILDEQGKDLLNPPLPEETTSSDSVKTELDSTSSSNFVTDISSMDTLQSDSITNQDKVKDTLIIAEINEPSPYRFLDSVDGKHIYIPLERRSIDSLLAEQINNITIRLLQEKGIPLVVAEKTQFGYCRDQACIRDSLSHYGASSVFQGSITAAKSLDSLNISMSRTLFYHPAVAGDSTLKTKDSVHTAQMMVSAFTALNDIIRKDNLNLFISRLQGAKIPSGKTKSYIRVESNPEGANIEIPGRDPLCKTPCTFATLDTGKITLYAYWNVDRHIWAAQSTLPIIPGDTNKISLKLKQSKPELHIISFPEGAEIYAGSSPLTKNTKAIGRTPSKYPIYQPGMSTVQLRKEGYRDTLVSVYAIPTGMTTVEVEMQPITDPAEQLQQQEWIKEKKKNFVGKTLMGSAIAPILVGALFTYLAHEDYRKADDIKNNLDQPATAGGEKYQKMVKENHDRVHDGNKKLAIGGSLLGVGAALFAIGFTLSF